MASTLSIRDFILREYAPHAPVTVVPTPVDLSVYRELEPQRIHAALGLEITELLLYVGRLAKEEDIDFLLCAFARVRAVRPQANLVLVGKGPVEEELQEMAHGLDLDKRVVFAGAISHSEVPQTTRLLSVYEAAIAVGPQLLEQEG